MTRPPFNVEKYEALMSGLQCNEISFIDLQEHPDYRWDSEYQTITVLKNQKLNYRKIGEILIKSEYGISQVMNEDEIGVPIYRMNEIQDMLCVSHPRKYVDIDETQLSKYKLNNGDILFNRTNSERFVGRSGIYYVNDNIDRVFASYLVRLVPDATRVLPEYLTAFLSSSFGRQEIKRRSRPSINQTNVNPEEVKDIPIPIVSMDLQRQVAKCFSEANQKIVLSLNNYAEAESILSQDLGLDNWQPSQKKASIRSSHDVKDAERWDAEYYQAKYDEIEYLIKKYKNGYSSISQLFHQNRDNPNFDRSEYKYIEIGDVNVRDGSCYSNIINTEDLPVNAKILVKKGDLLISKVRPYRGAVSIIGFDTNNDTVASGAFTILREKGNFKKEVLQVFLRIDKVKNWLLKWNVGTSYPVIKDEDILNLPIPTPSLGIQNEITRRISDAAFFRQQSIELLKSAKHAVEIAIKQNEQKASDYLQFIQRRYERKLPYETSFMVADEE